jgi:hypothetical protein
VFSVIDRWETLPQWSVTVIDVADGTMTRSHIDVCAKGNGWSIFMLDIDALDDRETVDGHLRVNHSADTPWSALAGINSRFYQYDGAVASACLAVGTADGLVRIAYADFPSVYIRNRNGGIRKVPGGGAPLGLFAEMRFPEKLCLLGRGDAMMLVNNGAQRLLDDGVITAYNLFAGRVYERESLPKRRFAATAISVKRMDFSVAEPQHARAEALVCA